MTTSGLGTTAVTSLSFVLSKILPLSMGSFVFLVNCGLFLSEVFILGKRFEKRMLWQLPAAMLFSSSIDLFMWMLTWLVPTAYWHRLAILAVGCIVFGAGVAMEVQADVVVLPAEAFCAVVHRVYQKDFGMVKTSLDICTVIIAALLSLCFLGNIQGVREGTLITAATIGLISRTFLKLFGYQPKQAQKS